MLLLLSVLLAAPVPEEAEFKAPTVKHVDTIERNGHTLLQFELINPNATPLHYAGYTSDSFEGGLKAGVISPIYRLEIKRGKDWSEEKLGWCGTGRGPVTIPAKGKGAFSVSVPTGEWEEARFGVTWFTGADRKTARVAWGAVVRKDLKPTKP